MTAIPLRNHGYKYKCLPIIYFFSVVIVAVVGWETCGSGYFCPDGNTCCLAQGQQAGDYRGYGCIPNDMGSYNATCCLDDDNDNGDDGGDGDGGQESGCPVGYTCRSNRSSRSSRSSSSEIGDNYNSHHHIQRSRFSIPISNRGDCVATDSAPMADDLVQILPRYKLCRIPHVSYTQLHGFYVSVDVKFNVIVDIVAKNETDNKDIANTITVQKKLAYYSSHGAIEDHVSPIDSDSNSDIGIDIGIDIGTEISNIDMVLIVVHGSGRNADDYFCSALAAVDAQSMWNKNNIWVIAPKFFDDSDADRPTNSDDGVEFMYWDHNDGDGAWRYGADDSSSSSSSSSSNGIGIGISSFTALDQLVDHLWKILPNLKQMVIAGHSSGGQFVNRWSLLTQSSWKSHHDKVKAIVANPSSYVYLTPLRWVQEEQQWKIPSVEILADCPNYNQWEWGLEDGGMFNVPYRNEAFKNKSNNGNNSTVAAIIMEFQRKRVIYLTGSSDQCSDKDDMPSCHSHGIETTCMDELQGSNRFQRSLRYMRSLEEVQVGMEKEYQEHHHHYQRRWENHTHTIVSGVGHDHSLMFTSLEGIEAIFGPFRRTITIDDDHITLSIT